MKNLWEISTEYATWSTQLSEKLQECETFLQGLPGKVSVSIADEENPTLELALMRDDGGQWRLMVLLLQCDTMPKGLRDRLWSHLLEQPVHVKARASRLIEPLIDQIRRNLVSGNQACEAAMEALEGLPLLAENEGEPSELHYGSGHE